MTQARSTNVKFRATLELHGKTATGMVVPPEVVERLGGGKRVAVRATIGGRYTYQTTVASMGGRLLMPVSAEHREKAGIGAGDKVEVTLALDDSPREVEVPEDLAKELARNSKAKAFFEGLSASQRKWFVTHVESAKKAETRERRLEEVVAMLKEGRKR